ASIIAKVTRDRMMLEIAKLYPEYTFEKHKGYGTKAHREMILEKGPIDKIHRKSFLKKILGE
ncbi:MAG: ribonuclease HII, partial [Cetobacterium sp.]